MRQILAWPDEELEYTHDFIQWLFPTCQPSAFNPDAPLVGNATIAAFKDDPTLRQAIKSAFERMIRFYGLELHSDKDNQRVVRSANWDARSAKWLTRGNHNLLRITRILASLRLLGLADLARAFFVALEEVYESPKGAVIGPVTYKFWKSAAQDEI